MAGLVTTIGSAAFADAAPAPAHAAAVDALLLGGCRVVARATMHELAYGVTGVNPWAGTPVNPTWPDRIPGGSSSGCAVAVAAGLVDFAVGTDTGGSIRMPAACCGVIGFKPSFGRVDRRGVHPAASSLDCVGPIAGDVETIERAMTLLTSGFWHRCSVGAATLGVLAVEADADVADAVALAVARSGLPTVPVTLGSFEQAFDAGLIVIGAEMWAAFGDRAGDPRLGEDVRARLRAASRITPDALAEAERTRARFTEEVDRVLETVDAIVLPTLPSVPLRVEEAGNAARAVRLTRLVRPFNLSGHPAITLPLRSAAGLPVGLQLVGRRGGDEALCAVAREIEERLASRDGVRE